MMKMVNTMRGSVWVEMNGSFPERFLNICAQNGILFWGVEKKDDKSMRAHLSVSGYKKLTAISKSAGFNIKIIKKDGVPQFLGGLRRRYALIAGVALFFALVIGVNQFIWDFDVQGNHLISEETILQNLSEIGVKIGSPVSKIDIVSIRNEMLLRLDSLLWISVNIKGSSAQVVVRERVMKPEMVPVKQPCNIVASKAGLITMINAYAGAAQVTVGQMVDEGDLLVSGIIDSSVLGARFVHAMGSVTARTWRDMTATVPTQAQGKQYTGRVHRRNALIIAGQRINLYKEGSAPYEFYDKIEKVSTLRVPPGVTFPIRLVTEEYAEYKTTPYEISDNAADGLLRSSLENRLYQSLGKGEVSDMKIVIEKKNGAMSARMTAECTEEIAAVVEIPLK